MNRKALVGVVAALLAVFVARVLVEIRGTSATYDEAYYLAIGQATLRTGDFRARKDKPMLTPYLLALPVFGSGAAFSPDGADWKAIDPAQATTVAGRDAIWRFTLDFLYHNTIPADAILFRARLAALAAALALALMAFLWARRLGGDWAGLAALAFAVLSPSVLAHAGLATEDMIATAFFFGAMFALDAVLERPSAGSGAWFGLAAACALMSKYTCVLLLPLSAAILAAAGAWRLSWWDRRRAAALVAAAAAGTAAFLLVYRGHVVEYVRGLEVARGYIGRGQMTFLHGRYSPRGFPEYFLVALLIKTPVPLLLLALPAFFRPSNYRSSRALLLIAPPLLLLGSASLSPMQIGHRYLLPLEPFLFVLAARVAASARWRPAAAAAVLWMAAESLFVQPHYLSYFNELAGGPENGWTYLVDANTDWGQDLKGLRAYVDAQGRPEMILSYYGAGVPEAVGFGFQDLFSFGLWGDKTHLNSAAPRRELLAVSVTNLQGVYLAAILGPDALAWLKERAPIARVGDSIFVYDVTLDAVAHERLSHAYVVSGNWPAASREARRALALEPGRPWASLLLAFATLGSNHADEADRLFPAAARGLNRIPFEAAIRSPRAQKLYSECLGILAARALARGQVDFAGMSSQLAAQIDPFNATASRVLADALRRKGAYVR